MGYDSRPMRSLVAALVSLALVVPAHAQQQPTADQIAEAKMHYQNAEAAMAEGRFDGAAAEYIEAYEVMKDPILFYKIGTAYQRAGKCDEALVFYRRYLREGKPADDFKKTVDERIAECDPAAAGSGTGTGAAPAGDPAVDTAPPPPDEPPPPPPDEPPPDEPPPDEPVEPLPTGTEPSFLDEKPSAMKSAGWVLVGTTIVFATAGTILAMSGQSREEDLEALGDFRDPQGRPATYDGNVRERYDDLVDEGDRFNTYATIAFVAAGVAAVTSATLLVLDGRRGGAESGSTITRTIVPVVGKDGGGVAATFRF